MSKRNTQQRRHIIITEVNTHGEVSVEALAKRFDISEVTIRKDLAALEKSGLLLRRYGGAVPLPQEITDAKESKVSVQKKSIAQQAATLIKDHYRVVIDSGRTTSTIIEHLSDKRGGYKLGLTAVRIHSMVGLTTDVYLCGIQLQNHFKGKLQNRFCVLTTLISSLLALMELTWCAAQQLSMNLLG